jgi:DNA-binding MarR family transcriptional regulator
MHSMNREALKAQLGGKTENWQGKADPNRNSPETISRRIFNLTRLRDVYIDSSLFRNSAWEVFLTLYLKREEQLQVSLASICIDIRLSEADGQDALNQLSAAGLVRLEDNPSGEGPQIIDLTDQGRQRMDAFIGAAERASKA